MLVATYSKASEISEPRQYFPFSRGESITERPTADVLRSFAATDDSLTSLSPIGNPDRQSSV